MVQTEEKSISDFWKQYLTAMRTRFSETPNKEKEIFIVIFEVKIKNTLDALGPSRNRTWQQSIIAFYDNPHRKRVRQLVHHITINYCSPVTASGNPGVTAAAQHRLWVANHHTEPWIGTVVAQTISLGDTSITAQNVKEQLPAQTLTVSDSYLAGVRFVHVSFRSTDSGSWRGWWDWFSIWKPGGFLTWLCQSYKKNKKI